MYLIDLEGNEFMLETTPKKTLSLSGDRSLSFVVQPTKTNKAFIYDIGELWQLVDEDDTEWTIIYVKSFGKGNSLSVEVKAVPRIFDYMNTNRIYEERDEHMTAFQCFEYIFEDTPYNFQLMDSFLAVQWQGFGGGKTLLEQFKDALNRYDAEFTIFGNEVRLYHQIGRDTEFMYHYKLNASNISKEADAEELWTYAKGFGDYESDEEPKLTREYRSPLADIVGVRHAPPFRDGRVKNVETMDQSLKELVDSSLKVSVTATLHDLREQGYPLAQPEPGDRVFLIDDRIDLKEEMRVVDLEETRNQKGELLKVVITLGSEGLGKRRQADIKHALAEITEVVQGRRQLPLTALDNAVREATRKLLSADTEVLHTENGLEMISKDDPNFVVIANSTGIGVSTDGGATFKNAITGDGVNTELLTAGTIDAQRVRITAGGENVLWVDSETGEVRMNVSSMSINFEPVATKKDLEEIETTPGESAVSAVLTKENHIIPVNLNDNNEDYTGAESEISVLQGDKNVTEDWDITIIPDENVSGQAPIVGETKFKVISMTGDTGSVWFEARKGDALLRREFRLTKVADGRDGEDGTPGASGKTAYELAVENGYQGTEDQWLQDLQGQPGEDGQPGKTAYELAVENGYTGTESEWLEDLKGEPGNPGDPGEPGKDGRSVSKITEQYYLSDSKISPTGGSWKDTPDDWVAGKYQWTRQKIEYENPASTDYTTPVVDAAWEAIEDVADEVEYVRQIVTIKDTRNLNYAPSHYRDTHPDVEVREFKSATVIGVEGTSTYGILSTIFTNGIVEQIYSADGRRFVRSGNPSTDVWNDWLEQETTDGAYEKAQDAYGDATGYASEQIQDAVQGVRDYADSLASPIAEAQLKQEEELSTLNANLNATDAYWRQTFSASGGGNEVHNSVGYAALEFWSGSGNITTIQNAELEVYGSGSAFIMGASSIMEQTIHTEPGVRTLSVLVNKDPTGSAFIEIEHDGLTEVISIDSGTEYVYTTLTKTFELLGTEYTVRITTDVGTELQFTNLMINTGDIPHKWSFAHDEIYGSTFQVNRNGLRVYHLEGTQYTAMTPDEFAGYAVVGGVWQRTFALNGDTTEVERLNARSEISMGEMGIIDVDTDQNKGWAFVRGGY